MNRGLADFKGEVETMNISGKGILHFPGSSAMTLTKAIANKSFFLFYKMLKMIVGYLLLHFVTCS